MVIIMKQKACCYLWVIIQIVIIIFSIQTLFTALLEETSGIEYDDTAEGELSDVFENQSDVFKQYFSPIHKYIDTIKIRICATADEKLYENRDILVINIADSEGEEIWKTEIPLKNIESYYYTDLKVKKRLATDKTYSLNSFMKNSVRTVDEHVVSAQIFINSAKMKENEGCSFNSRKSKYNADIIYHYRYFDVQGLCILIIAVIILNCCVYAIKKITTGETFKEKNKQLKVIGIILVPISVYVVSENILGNLFSIRPIYIVVNLLILSLLYGLFLLVFGNTAIAGIFFAICFTILSLVEYYVLLFRGKAFMLADLKSIKTAATVLESYSLQLPVKVAVNLLIMMGIIAIVCYMPSIIFEVNIKSMMIRVILVGIYIMTGGLFLNTPIMQKMNFEEINFWDIAAECQAKGSIYTLLLECQYNCIAKPKGYSLNKVREIETEIDKLQLNNKEVVRPENIICIMNESFADIEHIGKVDTDSTLLEFFHSLETNATKGWLQVPVFGGGTSESEYEVLTGNVKQFLALGSTAYELYCNDLEYGLTSILKKQGYSTIALHPFYGANWSREKIYPEMRFDKFFSIENWDSELEELRWFSSDKSSYNKLKELISNKEDGENLFTFLVTMQNHGGYSKETLGSYEPDISLNYAQKYPLAETYLSLINESDRALEDLVQYLENLDQPTMLIMFGDHYPNLEEKFYEKLYGKELDELELEEAQLRYQTPYIIWTNYESESMQEDMSANYLGACILEKAGLSMSKYDKFLLELRKEIPIIGMGAIEDSNGKWYDMDSLPEEYEDLINKYKILQYNRVKDKKNTCKSIFS